jgi:5-formyltetrahydrofolate cyclo-ligase
MIGDFAEGDGPAEFASPACFMHEVDPSYSGLGATSPELQRRAILRWRKSERQRLIVQRLGISSRDGIRCARGIAAQLDALLPDLTSIVVSLFWPFRGEPDLRNWADSIRARGAVCALPVVVEKNAPLIFRRWRAGGPLARGVWNIPVPADGPELAPDVVIAPLVGYDRQSYRLGYGGGFFDRTLAVLPKKPRAIGVGYSRAAITTIYPLAHDVPMDVIVTEEGIVE